MSGPRAGALFAGYGGLELAVREVFPAASPAWLAEFDAAPSRILAQRFPGVPNFGDVTAVDWAAVQPVEIVTGGSPCQDLSPGGKRAGMRPGTRSGLWASMADAVRIIRPRLVVWENVRGALSACAHSAVDSELGSCPRCMGAGRGSAHAPNVRAVGRVLGDLSALGYDAAWTTVRASDVGAAHQRERVFVLAWDAHAGTDPTWLDGRAAAHARGTRRDRLTLLPTPAVNDMGEGKTVEHWDAWTARMKTAHSNGNGHGKSLAIEALRGDLTPYAPAIARWEAVLGRPAPAPTEPTGKGGARQLSPRFVEWHMGLSDGWVTDTDTTRTEQLKALGNGVVPQQAAAAIRHLLAVRAAAMAGQGVAA